MYLRVAKNCQQNKLLYLAQHMHHQPQDKYVELPAGIVESTEASKKQVDLDEEIRRLEAELAADSPSDEDDVSDNDDEGSLSDMDDGRKRQVSFGQNSTLTFQRDSDSDHSEVQSDDNINGSGIICLSESANERIEPLPASAMPQIARKTAYDHVKKSKKRKLDKEELYSTITNLDLRCSKHHGTVAYANTKLPTKQNSYHIENLSFIKQQ